MATPRDSWFDIFRALGQAFFDVLRAEMDVLAEQWKRWGARAAIAAGLAALALVLVIVYLPGLLIFALIDGLHTAGGWPLWGAALGVALAITLVAMALVLVGWVFVRNEQLPHKAAASRFEDHLGWWRSKMLEAGPAELDDGALEGGGDDDEA